MKKTDTIIDNPHKQRESFTNTYHFVRVNKRWVLEEVDTSVSLWDVIKTKNYAE